MVRLLDMRLVEKRNLLKSIGIYFCTLCFSFVRLVLVLTQLQVRTGISNFKPDKVVFKPNLHFLLKEKLLSYFRGKSVSVFLPRKYLRKWIATKSAKWFEVLFWNRKCFEKLLPSLSFFSPWTGLSP